MIELSSIPVLGPPGTLKLLRNLLEKLPDPSHDSPGRQPTAAAQKGPARPMVPGSILELGSSQVENARGGPDEGGPMRGVLDNLITATIPTIM